MRPALILNHSFLDGAAKLPLTAATKLRSTLVEIGDTLKRTRQIRGDATLYVHPLLTRHEVGDEGDNKTFWDWASACLRSPEWKSLIDPLIQLVSGPFYDRLDHDDLGPPEDSEPSCQSVPEWLRELVLSAGHHALSCDHRAWILSYGPCRHLTEREYRFVREARVAAIDNLRTDQEASTAEAAHDIAEGSSTRQILEAAVRHTQRVVVLDTARKSADRWTLDCPPERLFTAIVGLDAYAAALDSGVSRETATTLYQDHTSVEMSQEKAASLKRPSVRSAREFRVPDGTKKLFDMHAKPGSATRVHIYTLRDPSDDPKTPGPTRVYIGHCGEHLPLR